MPPDFSRAPPQSPPDGGDGSPVLVASSIFVISGLRNGKGPFGGTIIAPWQVSFTGGLAKTVTDQPRISDATTSRCRARQSTRGYRMNALMIPEFSSNSKQQKAQNRPP